MTTFLHVFEGNADLDQTTWVKSGLKLRLV